MDLKFACPACGKHVVVDSSAGGSQIKCSGCGIEFPVPELISHGPPPVPPSSLPPVPNTQPVYDSISFRKETSVVPVMLLGLAVFFLILAVWFVVGTVIPNFKAGREQAKRQMREQEAEGRVKAPAPEIIQPTKAEADSVQIHYGDFAWRSYGTADGEVLIVTCPIENPTRYKLVNMTLTVRCYDPTDKVAIEKTKRRLTDAGMDFAPPNQLKNHEIMVELGSLPASSVIRVEVKIEDFQCTAMTDLDTRLISAQERLKQFKNSNHDTMAPGQAEAYKEFMKLLEEKRRLTGP